MLVFMILLTAAAIGCTSGMGSSRDSVVFNLRSVPQAREVFCVLTDIAAYIQEESEDKEAEMVACLETQLDDHCFEKLYCHSQTLLLDPRKLSLSMTLMQSCER